MCVVFGAPRLVGVRVDSGMRIQAMFRICINRLQDDGFKRNRMTVSKKGF